MARPARVVALNLGTQTIGLAEFQRTANGDGVLLNAFQQTEILADPGAEAARLPQIRFAVNELKGGLKLRGRTLVNYAVSGQNLFARFVKLPTVAEDKVEQIIGFEAQQNVPFPIDEVIWDYQLVAGGKNGAATVNDGQVEVVLVAIKADLLDGLNDAAQGAGFRTHVVDAAPMALYNAFRYNYADAAGGSLLIDLGARTTNLIFVEAGKVFSRSIPIGGNAITQAIAKEFAEPFQAAEQRKRSGGYVALGGTYAEDKDPEIARMAKLIRNTMTRLHAEIGRSINFYRAQQGGSQPQRVFLCGGTANLPYLREFFAEKIHQAPVEFFNPLRNVTVGPTVNVEAAAKSAHQLGELVGLGLRGLLDCPMQLNLRPTSVVRAQQANSRRPYLAAAVACLLAALAGWWIYYLRAAQIKEAVVEQLSAKVAGMQGIEKQFQRLKADTDALTARAAPLTQAIEDRQFYPRLLNDLNSRLPREGTKSSHVWITQLEPTAAGRVVAFEDPGKPLTPGGTPTASGANPRPPARPAIDGLHLKGLYLSNPRGDAVVEDFVRELAKSPHFDLDLNNPKTIILSRSPQTDQAWAFDYELQLRLKPGFAQPLP